MRTTVYAQQTNPDGLPKVYRVPFPTVRQARGYCRGTHAPERAMLVTRHGLERYDHGRLVGKQP